MIPDQIGKRILYQHSKVKFGPEGQRLALPQTLVYRQKRDAMIALLVDRVWAGENLDNVLSGLSNEWDERVIEYPFAVYWLRKLKIFRYLDAGCVMNNRVVDRILREQVTEIWLNNLVTEPLQISLPVYFCVSKLDQAFQNTDIHFDAITCLSTIEHIGYDNLQYGADSAAIYNSPSMVPLRESLEKLVKILKPEGSLLVSVPYGFREVLIHPHTGKRSSQVFDLGCMQDACDFLTGLGMRTNLELFGIKDGVWQRISEIDDPKSFRYAQVGPAASGVAFIVGGKRKF